MQNQMKLAKLALEFKVVYVDSWKRSKNKDNKNENDNNNANNDQDAKPYEADY